jgi:AcrB/AcrD/AcrF family
MQFTDFFIRRAITTTLLILAIAGFGVLSYFSLPVSNLPEVEYPTIQVSAELPGANPDAMASTVATPLESEFSEPECGRCCAGCAGCDLPVAGFAPDGHAFTSFLLESKSSRRSDPMVGDVVEDYGFR